MLEFYTTLLVYLFFLASQWFHTFKSFSNLHYLGLTFFYIRDFFGIGYLLQVFTITDLKFGMLYDHFYAENLWFLASTPWCNNSCIKTCNQNKVLVKWNNFVFIWSWLVIWFQSYDHFKIWNLIGPLQILTNKAPGTFEEFVLWLYNQCYYAHDVIRIKTTYKNLPYYVGIKAKTRREYKLHGNKHENHANHLYTFRKWSITWSQFVISTRSKHWLIFHSMVCIVIYSLHDSDVIKCDGLS